MRGCPDLKIIRKRSSKSKKGKRKSDYAQKLTIILPIKIELDKSIVLSSMEDGAQMRVALD